MDSFLGNEQGAVTGDPQWLAMTDHPKANHQGWRSRLLHELKRCQGQRHPSGDGSSRLLPLLEPLVDDSNLMLLDNIIRLSMLIISTTFVDRKDRVWWGGSAHHGRPFGDGGSFWIRGMRKEFCERKKNRDMRDFARVVPAPRKA